MHTESPLLARQESRAVEPWAFMVGGSVGIAIGFGVDLLRLGVYRAKQALAQRGAGGSWPCRQPCDAGSR